MGKNKQVTCKICYRTMRSDHQERHMKVHSKIEPEPVNPTPAETKRKFKEPVDSNLLNRELSVKPKLDLEALKTVVIQRHQEYLKKKELGKAVYNLLEEWGGEEEELLKELKDALDLYIKDEIESVILYPWQSTLLQWIESSTDKHYIWIVGEAGGEGKSWFQKYVRSMFGIRRVVSGIDIKSNTENIYHCLSKQSLATADIFLFDIDKTEGVNYQLLQDLKDGDTFTSKSKLIIQEPKVVMVFSNDEPSSCELSYRWKLYHIQNDHLIKYDLDCYFAPYHM